MSRLAALAPRSGGPKRVSACSSPCSGSRVRVSVSRSTGWSAPRPAAQRQDPAASTRRSLPLAHAGQLPHGARGDSQFPSWTALTDSVSVTVSRSPSPCSSPSSPPWPSPGSGSWAGAGFIFADPARPDAPGRGDDHLAVPAAGRLAPDQHRSSACRRSTWRRCCRSRSGRCAASWPASRSSWRRRPWSTAARGCGAFRSITLPLHRAGSRRDRRVRFIQAWNEFIFALVLMNRPDHLTLPVWLRAFRRPQRHRLGRRHGRLDADGDPGRSSSSCSSRAGWPPDSSPGGEGMT